MTTADRIHSDLVRSRLVDACGGRLRIARTFEDGDLVATYGRMLAAESDHPDAAIVDIVRTHAGAILSHWRVTRPLPDVHAAGRGPFEGLAYRGVSDSQRRRNRDVVERMQRLLFQEHRVEEAIDECFDADHYIQHAPGAPDGVAFLREGFRRRFDENPGARSRLLHILADGDLVLTHRRSRLSPGSPVRAVCDIFRLRRDRIVEHWDVTQVLTGDEGRCEL